MDVSILKPDFALEHRLWDKSYRVVGIDEAGRGTWAGPLFVGAVWLKPQHVVALKSLVAAGKVRDSKKLSSRQRVTVYRALLAEGVEFAVGEAVAPEIDSIGIERAFQSALRRALDALTGMGIQSFPLSPDAPLALLVDGKQYAGLPVGPDIEVFAEDKLDNACVAVALASIVAKVHQEATMRGLDFLYPEYGFAKHNGYMTQMHREGVKKHGLSIVHRKTWRNPDV